VQLTWSPVTDDDLLGYDVLRGASAYGPFERLNAAPLTGGSLYVDRPLPGFSTFHYHVVARDSSANQSSYSETVTVATGPPLAIGWPIAKVREGGAAIVIEDLDGLPGAELVTGSDAIYVWHADGTELLDGDANPLTSGIFSTDGRSSERGFQATPAIADLDGDGDLDVIAVAWDAQAVYAWDGATATPLAGWPQELSHDFNWSAPVIDDLDLDGDSEVLAVSGKLGKLYGWHHDGSEIRDGDGDPGTHGVLFDTETTWLYATPSVGDVDGDIFPEIVVGENALAGRLHVLDHNGIEQSPFPRELGGQVTASAALADLDLDGRLDIVVSAESDTCFVLDGLTGEALPGWPQPAVTEASFARTSSPIVCDVDLDGSVDVVYAASDGRMHVWDRQGQMLPGWDSVRFADMPGDATQCTPTVADIDGDGGMEILVGAEDGHVHGWHADGSIFEGFPLAAGGEVRGAPVLWDVDEDGRLELLVASYDRNVYIWDLEGKLDAARTGWPFMRRDVRNTGRLGEDFLAVSVGPAMASGIAAPRVALLGIAPNPLRDAAWLRFELARDAPARLSVYDVQGRLVRRLLDDRLSGGVHRLRWDGRGADGRRMATGVYFLRLEQGTATRTLKLTIVR
jgi:WD40 repeat protein